MYEAAVVLVALGIERRQVGWADLKPYRVRLYTDVGEDHPAHVGHCRHQPMRRLKRAEGDRNVILPDRRKQCAAITAYSAWQVAGDSDQRLIHQQQKPLEN